MNACIASYYMSNINPKTVELQKRVVEKFNRTKLPHLVMKGEIPHGAFMDYVWSTNGAPVNTIGQIKQELNFDIVLFLDIDCIPLNENAIDYFVSRAFHGKLIGNAQRSGHIVNNNHVFAAPSAVALSVENFKKIGSPSALETKRGDVAEEYTYCAEQVGVELELILPTKYDRDVYRYDWEQDRRPYWTLENGLPNFGLGTSYGNEEVGDMFWHNFQIRIPGQEEHFWEKCEDILNG
jgi:hypothetical protein